MHQGHTATKKLRGAAWLSHHAVSCLQRSCGLRLAVFVFWACVFASGVYAFILVSRNLQLNVDSIAGDENYKAMSAFRHAFPAESRSLLTYALLLLNEANDDAGGGSSTANKTITALPEAREASSRLASAARRFVMNGLLTPDSGAAHRGGSAFRPSASIK